VSGALLLNARRINRTGHEAVSDLVEFRPWIFGFGLTQNVLQPYRISLVSGAGHDLGRGRVADG
jgi:hypothetical protein